MSRNARERQGAGHGCAHAPRLRSHFSPFCLQPHVLYTESAGSEPVTQLAGGDTYTYTCSTTVITKNVSGEGDRQEP